MSDPVAEALAVDATPEPTIELVPDPVDNDTDVPALQELPTLSPVTVFENEVAQSNAILDALMARIGDVNEQSPWCNIFIYGPPGVGKSVILGTCKDNLIVNVEDGAKSIMNHPNLIRENRPKALEYKSVFQVEQLVKFKKEHAEPLEKYKVFSVDSFNSLSDRALVELVRAEALKDSSRNPYLPVGTDYNINTQHMKQLATDMHDLECHVVFVAHSTEIKDESTGRILIRPALTPKLAGAIAGLFDLVGYLTADVTETGITNQRLQIFPTDKVLAKTRIGGLPAVIENPTLDMIFESYEKSRQAGILK